MNNDLLKSHAKSFYWASFFLSKEIYSKCSALYNFCRTLDDIVDDSDNLEIKKKNFLKFKNDFTNRNLENLIIKSMWQVIEEENISKKIIFDLFDGVETDLFESVKIKSKKDLLVYSYRVAGTVGLMMSKILKVKNKESLKGAIDLGIAMQLTNIARDVIEDKNRNREYIEFSFSSIKETVYSAEMFYKKSFFAIRSIPIKSRFSVIVARRVYRKIGDYILKQENIEKYRDAGKIYVPLSSKILETILSIFDFLRLLFVKNISYYNNENHITLNQEINLNERI
ncbi:squalene/phytoene synthase family protein [Candidatus Pelagibacter bacterium]|nr:squalene/phytoene synthase family protein [Candidatus Pelagibacter bacterium]